MASVQLFIVGLVVCAILATKAASRNDNGTQVVKYNGPVWHVVFGQRKLNMTMTQTRVVGLEIPFIDPAWGQDFKFYILPRDDALLRIMHVVDGQQMPLGTQSWMCNFSVEALLLGHTDIYVELRRPNFEPEVSAQSLNVVIMRNIGDLDTVFKVCVGAFVMILYVNFGAALDLEDLKRILLRPVGPAIGFVGQFLVMPVLSYLIGYYLFHDMIELRLGLFFTGATPGGGASNIFTVILNGNLNLSITMTALSNLAAFGMMPLWIFTLGALIFRDGNFSIPYESIAMMSFSLVLPLCVGVMLQKFSPGIAKRMARWLKPIAVVLIVFITAFAFTVNSFMFQLFSAKVLIAACCLPWAGYLFGWLLAVLFRQSPTDALTIAIETGIQNSGIAIFMLNFTLPQPQADMTSAVPVASSMMTPLPLLLLYLLQKCFRRTSIEEVEEAPTKQVKDAEVQAIMDNGRIRALVEKQTAVY